MNTRLFTCCLGLVLLIAGAPARNLAQTPSGAPAPPQTHVPITPQQGAQVFASHGCAFCHGPHLAGTERAPSLLEVHKKLKPEQMTHQIHDGGKGMPAFGDQLSPDEIQALVAFLHSRHPEKLTPAGK